MKDFLIDTANVDYIKKFWNSIIFERELNIVYDIKPEVKNFSTIINDDNKKLSFNFFE